VKRKKEKVTSKKFTSIKLTSKTCNKIGQAKVGANKQNWEGLFPLQLGGEEERRRVGGQKNGAD